MDGFESTKRKIRSFHLPKPVLQPQSQIKKRPEWARKHGNVISAKLVKNLFKPVGRQILPHPTPCSPNLVPSDYLSLYTSMRHATPKQHFSNFQVGKWLEKWFAVKAMQFFWDGIRQLLTIKDG